MKSKLNFLFLVIAIISFSCKDDSKIELNPIDKQLKIIPKPVYVKTYEGIIDIESNIDIVAKNEDEINVANMISEYFSKFNVKCNIKEESDNFHIDLKSDSKIDSLESEGYLLATDNIKIQIQANSGSGLYYGFQTLIQFFPTPEYSNKISIPFVKIYDKPEFKWRGLHLDVCRHFFPVDFIKKYIDNMSKYKLNTFHWHLTEDQGWRIEIKKYPKLTEIGSKRKETILEKNFNPYIGDGIPHGGFYTQEEIKEIVEYAKKRYVTIVPEIEMPGHSQAALAAYPEYGCTDQKLEVWTKWGVTENIYCPKEETFQFLTDILDEVCDLFPSEYIHIGGDEAPKKQWIESEFCQNLIKQEGLTDESELQSYFIKRIEKHLISKNKRLIGWDEILEGGLAPEATVMSWRGEAGGIEAAKSGHDVIMTPGFAMYFDHYQGDRDQEPLAIGGFSPLEKVYNYNPLPVNALNKNELKHILGVQANVWTEYIPSTDHVEYMVYPRLLALSEISWTKFENKNYDIFLESLQNHFPRLDYNNINYRLPEPFGLEDNTIYIEGKKSIRLYTPIINGKILYTLDGSEPNINSAQYSDSIIVDLQNSNEILVKAITISNNKQSITAKTLFVGKQ